MIKTIETRLKEHLSDTKSIVYKNKDKNPITSLVIDCPCKNKHKLEKKEKKHINDYAKNHGDKVLNKRGNEEINKKPEIKYSFKIEKEEDLLNRIEKIPATENDEKNKQLKIRFRNGGKNVKVIKRYGKISLAEATDYIKVQQRSLKLQLI